MKPTVQIDSARTDDGSILALFEHDGEYRILVDGLELMSTRATASELEMGVVGVARLQPDAPARVLIGGLGLGYTLASVLEHTRKSVAVEVVELLPAVVEWNRTHLRDINGHLLTKKRVRVRETDVTRYIERAEPSSWDVILLDIDNGPTPIVTRKNGRLYTFRGVQAVHRALTPNGRAVFWSNGKDKDFERRLHDAGFTVKAVPVKRHERAKKFSYLLYVADRSRRAHGWHRGDE